MYKLLLISLVTLTFLNSLSCSSIDDEQLDLINPEEDDLEAAAVDDEESDDVMNAEEGDQVIGAKRVFYWKRRNCGGCRNKKAPIQKACRIKRTKKAFTGYKRVCCSGFKLTNKNRCQKITAKSPGRVTLPANCGRPKVTPQHARIVGGENAIPHSYPWQISLRAWEQHICGGSIIASQYIVTAAHCAVSGRPSTFQVRIGEHDQKASSAVERDINVIKITIHPRYNANTLTNDIAILKLAETITFNKYASPVCLPSADPNDDQIVTVTGWGNTETYDDRWTILQQVRVPIVPQSICVNNYKLLSNVVSNDMICAGKTGKDSCQGDSGGPMVYATKGVYELVGVVSWGIGCAEKDQPGVYTRVSYFNDWIRNNLF